MVRFTLHPSAARVMATRYFSGNDAGRVSSNRILRASLVAGTSYLGHAGWRVYEEARRRGAYLRPLGDTVYVCPPLVIGERDLDDLLGILEESVRAALG